MMLLDHSWYVEILLVNRDDIKSMVYDSSTKSLEVASMDSSYDDLLTVEKKVTELINKNLIPQKELEIASLIFDNNSYSGMHTKFGISRHTSVRAFRKFCARVAYHLGGKFPDLGYISYMKNKYNLDEDAIEKLEKFIKSNRRLK